MATITSWPITLEQFLSLPEAKPALEFGPEGVTQKVSPSTEHALLQLELATLLNRHARSRRAGRAFTELRVILTGFTRVPDVAFYREDRLPRAPGGGWLRYPTSTPDLVAEIASPGQPRQGLAAVCRWFVDQGCPVALLVDPRQRAVTAFTATGASVMHGAERLPLGEALSDLTLTPAALFSVLDD